MFLTYNSGDNDEQAEKPEKLWAAQIRGLGLDYVHNNKLGSGEAEECQHSVQCTAPHGLTK